MANISCMSWHFIFTSHGEQSKSDPRVAKAAKDCCFVVEKKEQRKVRSSYLQRQVVAAAVAANGGWQQLGSPFEECVAVALCVACVGAGRIM